MPDRGPLWLYEAGIGENRAALVDQGQILELALEWDDDPPLRTGAILPARLLRRPDGTGRALALLEDGPHAQLTPAPPGMTEGQAFLAEITREALPEGAETKPPRIRVAPPGATPMAGPDLLARLQRSGHPVRHVTPADDALDAHGWAEAMEQAAGGVIATPDALLRIALTPAMTLIDVDGTGAAAELAIAGARAAGQAIRRFAIAGSIGIDLPTLAGKADRQAAAQALDDALPPPFERTAVNGFGFLQIVRRRERPSVLERIAADPVGTAVRALLRQGQRARGAGPLTLHAAPAVIRRIEARPDWTDALARSVAAPVALRADPALAISAGHASRAHP